jgi:hypothetical protein
VQLAPASAGSALSARTSSSCDEKAYIGNDVASALGEPTMSQLGGEGSRLIIWTAVRDRASSPRSSSSACAGRRSAARPRAGSPRARCSCASSSTRAARSPGLVDGPLPPPPLRTKWTRRVPHPALIGHAASLTPYSPGLVGATEPHCKQPQRRPPAPARRQPCARRRGLRDAPGAARSGAARSGAEGVWDAQGGVLRPGAAAAARARSEWSELARKADNTSKVNSCCARAGRVAARASRVGCRVARPPRRGGRCVARRCPVSF